MKTPITDAIVVSDESLCHEGYVWIDPAVASRLELDRAALMEALQMVRDTEDGLPRRLSPSQLAVIDSALAAARANFPEL